MTKTRKDNDVIEHISAVYVENYNELLGPIGPGVVCDEKQIGQSCDISYRCGLRRKRNHTIKIDRTSCGL